MYSNVIKFYVWKWVVVFYCFCLLINRITQMSYIIRTKKKGHIFGTYRKNRFNIVLQPFNRIVFEEFWESLRFQKHLKIYINRVKNVFKCVYNIKLNKYHTTEFDYYNNFFQSFFIKLRKICYQIFVINLFHCNIFKIDVRLKIIDRKVDAIILLGNIFSTNKSM